MKNLNRNIVLLMLSMLLSNLLFSQKTYYNEDLLEWKNSIPPPESEKYHSIVLIGDIKYPATDSTIMMLLKNKLDGITGEGSLLVLGDIVYPHGLAPPESKDHEAGKADIDMILKYINDFEGNVIFIPGNHDWDRGGIEGLERVLYQQEYIMNAMGRDDVYLPLGGCPGPEEVHLADDIVVIVFDSEWWFNENEKPGPEDGCDFEVPADLFIQIEDIIRRNNGKKIIFACHHPLFSVGNHGGYFNASRNIFPLLDVQKWMYIPLPGFISTGYRKYLGHIQDLAHPEYKVYIQHMLDVFRDYPNMIYAAGHEHNLQYFRHDSLHHIISGGGGEGLYISRKEKKTDFACMSEGLSILNYYENGDVWVEFWIPGGEEGKQVFSHKLYSILPQDKELEAVQIPNYSDSTVIIKITDIYDNGEFVSFWMGDNYRDLWKAKVEIPVFDIGTEKGGLTILKRGGGQQTRSLRMEAPDGKQYVLRSVNKYVGKALVEEMQNTFAEAAVQDGISSSHPYGAVTIPPMAHAANVMHTNPHIVWVPDDPRLGIYRKDLANNIFLFEERPAGDWSDAEFFGYSKDIIGTPDLIDKTHKEHDHIVDQKAVLNARLFDIFLNDWDRHDDQWRWAKFKEGDTKVYRPVPRDRDQAYFVNEGPVMWIAKQPFIMPKFQGFDHEISNVNGLGFNARYFDRAFLTGLDLDDWLAIANKLEEALTDSVIHEAIIKLPPEIYELSGEEIEAKLASRRSLIPIYTENYYRYLSKEVDVVATNERDLFKVKRLENGNTEVRVFALSDKKGKVKEQLYYREFKPDETDEIRLYGLKDDDRFEIDGEAKKAIKIRLIGGKNNDTIIDNSRIRGWGKSLWVYERKDKKNYVQKGPETRLFMSNDKSIDDYNRKQFKYDIIMPLISAGYNIDDGVFLGGGVKIDRYNFRDSTSHRITGRIAFATGAFGIDYKGLYAVASRFFDVELDASIAIPSNVDNFFGIGNQTERITDDKSYYRVRYQYAFTNPWLRHTVNEKINYKFGAFYQYFEVTDTNDRFIGNPELSGLDSLSYEKHHFTGLSAAVEIDTRNSKVLPLRGMHFLTDIMGFYGLNEEAKNFVRIRSDLSFYLSFRKDPRFVFAFRFGGAMNLGDYEFYHANTLGGKTNLRGFRSRRFAGDHSFYQNTEIRMKLLNVNSFIMNGQIGIFAFNDIGRVWVDDENSSSWHDGYGGGIWLTPFEFTAVTFGYQRSYDDHMFVFTLKFIF